jgi:hypothetical protein
LTAFSFAADDAGLVQIFRNLIDLREPTLGVRPPAANVVSKSLRQGLFYKDELREGPLDLWNNTYVVFNAGGVGDPPWGCRPRGSPTTPRGTRTPAAAGFTGPSILGGHRRVPR